MGNLVSIIETVRKLREQKNISLKQPISSLTVVNRKQGLFEGLSALLPYIRDEINVEDIRHEPNVEKYVRLEALPNLPVLGPKFKGNKAFGDIRNAITKLGTAELEEVRASGSLTVLGHALEAVLPSLLRATSSFRRSS